MTTREMILKANQYSDLFHAGNSKGFIEQYEADYKAYRGTDEDFIREFTIIIQLCEMYVQVKDNKLSRERGKELQSEILKEA